MLNISRFVIPTTFLFCWLIILGSAMAADAPFDNEQFILYEQSSGVDLSAEDLRYVKDNQIVMPELSSAEKGGLHKVINDPRLMNDPTTRKNWVTYYLSVVATQNFSCELGGGPNLHCELSTSNK